MTTIARAATIIAIAMGMAWPCMAEDPPRLPVDRTVRDEPIKTLPCATDCHARLRMRFLDGHVEVVPAQSKASCSALMCEVWRAHACGAEVTCDPSANSTSRQLCPDRKLKQRSVLLSAECVD